MLVSGSGSIIITIILFYYHMKIDCLFDYVHCHFGNKYLPIVVVTFQPRSLYERIRRNVRPSSTNWYIQLRCEEKKKTRNNFIWAIKSIMLSTGIKATRTTKKLCSWKMEIWRADVPRWLIHLFAVNLRYFPHIWANRQTHRICADATISFLFYCFYRLPLGRIKKSDKKLN